MTMHAFTVRLFLALMLLGPIGASLRAQDTGGGDEYDFSDIPVEEEELPYIGVGGGYALLVSFPQWDNLNKQAAALGIQSTSGGTDAFSGPLFMHGGGGWTAIGIIKNVRLGVFGGGGSKSATLDTAGFSRTMRFNAGYTAAQIDYAIPIARALTVVPGVMLGSVTNTLTVVQTAGGTVPFDSLFGPAYFDSSPINRDRLSRISSSSFLVYPVLNIEYAITQFIMLRVGGGYTFNLSGTWRDEQDVEVTGVPKISSAGPTIQAGLFLGLFQQ